MKCRQCGKRIPGKLLKLEEYSCPYCGEVYWNEPHASVTGHFRRQRRRRSWWSGWFPPDRRQLAILGGVLLVLVLLIVGISLAARRPKAPAQPVAAQTGEPATVSHADWLAKAAGMEEQVKQAANQVLSAYTTQGETKVGYIAAEHDRFYITTPDIILSSNSKQAIVKVIRALESAVAKSNVPYGIGWRASFKDTAGKLSCQATFGDGFNGYTFVMNGNNYTYKTLSEIK